MVHRRGRRSPPLSARLVRRSSVALRLDGPPSRPSVTVTSDPRVLRPTSEGGVVYPTVPFLRRRLQPRRGAETFDKYDGPAGGSTLTRERPPTTQHGVSRASIKGILYSETRKVCQGQTRKFEGGKGTAFLKPLPGGYRR